MMLETDSTTRPRSLYGGVIGHGAYALPDPA